METKVIQIRQKGTVTLPARIRERYGFSDGDPLTVIDIEGAIVLSPKVGVVPKLAKEIERLREEAGISLDQLIEGQMEQRRRSK